MTITLDAEQISWIGDRISEAKVEARKVLEAGIHNIDEARAVVEYDDFLNKLNKDIGILQPGTPKSRKLEEPEMKVPETSSDDIGAPVIPEVVKDEEVAVEVETKSVEDKAKEEMNEAREQQMEDIFNM